MEAFESTRSDRSAVETSEQRSRREAKSNSPWHKKLGRLARHFQVWIPAFSGRVLHQLDIEKRVGQPMFCADYLRYNPSRRAGI